MAEGEGTAAKRRASYARADRLKKEAQHIAGLEQVGTIKGHPLLKVRNDLTLAERKIIAGVGQKFIDGTLSDDDRQKARQQLKAIDEAKKEALRKTVEQKANQQKVAEARKAEQRKRDEQQKSDQKKQDTAKLDAQRQEQRKQEAKKRAEERKAAAYVLAEFKRQQADQNTEQRRQIGRMRIQHREQSSSLRDRGGEAIDRHWQDVKTIDNRETQALKAFDVKRASLTGRAVELVRGKAHFERQREDIQKRFESDRLHKHRDLEALKERQFNAQQDQRLRHGKERKAMFESLREARNETLQRQERDRPRLIEQRLQAVAKNAEIARTHQQEQTQEHGRSMRSQFGR